LGHFILYNPNQSRTKRNYVIHIALTAYVVLDTQKLLKIDVFGSFVVKLNKES